MFNSNLLDSNLLSIFLLLLVGYLFFYFGGRKYLENFDSNTSKKYLPEKPYMTTPIDDLDDYEVSSIFKNQGSKEASKQQISDAMTRYPMDWSTQGPGSQYFQDNQEQYEKDKPQSLPGEYKEVEPTLPDTLAMEEEELKILQTYKPESSKGLLQYSLDDVKSLVERIYSKKGLIPVIEKSKQGPNIWEIVEVKEKNPTIVWEDEVKTEREMMTSRREEVIEVPYTVSDVASGLDPYFQSRSNVRDGKHDYNKFTPGLERMFAPTYPIKAWS